MSVTTIIILVVIGIIISSFVTMGFIIYFKSRKIKQQKKTIEDLIVQVNQQKKSMKIVKENIETSNKLDNETDKKIGELKNEKDIKKRKDNFLNSLNNSD